MTKSRSLLDNRLMQELRRRHVFRVAALYIASCWVVVGVLDIALPLLGAPEWLMRTAVLVALAGLPIALTLSWFFELQPDSAATASNTSAASSPGKDRSIDFVVIAILGAALAVTLAGQFISAPAVAPLAAVPSGVLARHAQSIAVVPIQSRGAAQTDEYLLDGLTEALIFALSEQKDLRVAPASSSFYFKDKQATVSEVAEKLQVRYVLEGSARNADDGLEVTVQLVDSEESRVVWNRRVLQDSRDVLDAQQSIASDVANLLLPATAEQLQFGQPTTQSTDAFDLYLKGQALLRQADREDEALLEFKAALAADPNFVEAQAGRCNAYLRKYQHFRREVDFLASESACFRALTLQKEEQRSWEVRVALGALYSEAGQYDKAELELERANVLHANSAQVYQQLGMVVAKKGDKVRAEELLRGAIALEPTFWDVRLTLANFFYAEARFDESELVLRQMLEIVPQHFKALSNLGATLYMLGRNEDAAQQWELAQKVAPDNQPARLAILWGNLGTAYYYSGQFSAAMTAHQHAIELTPDDHRPWGRMAEAARGAGLADDARAAYQEAIRLAHSRLGVNPNDWESLGLLGLYYGFVDKSLEARTYADKMLSVVPENSTAHYFDALIYLSINDPDGAFNAMGAAADLGFSRTMLAQDPDLKSLAKVDPLRYEMLVDSGAQ